MQCRIAPTRDDLRPSGGLVVLRGVLRTAIRPLGHAGCQGGTFVFYEIINTDDGGEKVEAERLR